MTVKRTLTIEVEMYSDASEAHLKLHLDDFINEMKSTSENMRFQSWHQSIDTSWDESHSVDINITTIITDQK